MIKQELYRELCIEAGTLIAPELSSDEWYSECSHNITPDLDATLEAAAAGDVAAMAEARQACGLPVLV